jgi:[ribosomal protein S18]-alanine N-acetyltransferase
MPATEPVVVRAMEARDVPAVVAIEEAAFTMPWHAETFLALVGRPGHELLVCESPEGEIVAYAVVSIVLDQAELANIAVREDWRGRRIGSSFLDRILETVREREIRELFLEVRESNLAGRALYEKRGFEEIGRRRDYYDAPREDALQLVKRF